MSRLIHSSQLPRTARTLAIHMAMEAAQRAEIGERIRTLRGPVPQPVLANKLGISLRAIQKWESGESAPQWDNLVRLSKHFQVTQDYLLYGDREPAPEAKSADSAQLDRIEAKLDELLSILKRSGGPAEVLEAEADRLDEQQRSSAASSKRTGKRASGG